MMPIVRKAIPMLNRVSNVGETRRDKRKLTTGLPYPAASAVGAVLVVVGITASLMAGSIVPLLIVVAAIWTVAKFFDGFSGHDKR